MFTFSLQVFKELHNVDAMLVCGLLNIVYESYRFLFLFLPVHHPDLFPLAPFTRIVTLHRIFHKIVYMDVGFRKVQRETLAVLVYSILSTNISQEFSRIFSLEFMSKCAISRNITHASTSSLRKMSIVIYSFRTPIISFI